MKMGQPVYYARGSGKLQHLVPLPKGVGLPCEAIPELRITFSIVTVDLTHGSLALKAYQQNLYLKYYY